MYRASQKNDTLEIPKKMVKVPFELRYSNLVFGLQIMNQSGISGGITVKIYEEVCSLLTSKLYSEIKLYKISNKTQGPHIFFITLLVILGNYETYVLALLP